ncbi:hypothetical protein [Mesomycoplasma neurolyticum]|uniref:Uncharacterized protein n=1 Tax=Mesomycoplasma neurolyticum TaxID=2120 RepID=A0A449A5M5_9BACT|nr:hypothetical protein [Mesomycoplasma neurolyticum]VEU59529.1 Uncharacterised protein [Mesomycoplasma neurolyticum]
MDINERIGILDRKIRIINDNSSKKKWYFWVKKAFMSIYGFEFQGDNLYIARKNLFLSFIEYYLNKFNRKPSQKKQKEIAEIISWNFWQMDGLKFVIPFSCEKKSKQIDLFDQNKFNFLKCEACHKNNNTNHLGISSKINLWQENLQENILEFKKILNKGV